MSATHKTDVSLPAGLRKLDLKNLSVEVLLEIFSYLGIEDILNLRLVCAHFDGLMVNHFCYIGSEQSEWKYLSDELLLMLFFCRLEARRFKDTKLVQEAVRMAAAQGSTGDSDPRALRKTLCNAMSAYKGRDWIVTYLKEPSTLSTGDGSYEIVLAAWLGFKNVVETQLEKGVSPNRQHCLLGTALYAASYNDDEDIVRILIEKGADLD